LAVVPLDEVGVGLGHGAEAGQLAGAPGAPQRAGPDARERQAPQAFAEADGVGLAAFGERQVGAAAGVLPGDGPRRLAVAGQVDRGQRRHDPLRRGGDAEGPPGWAPGALPITPRAPPTL